MYLMFPSGRPSCDSGSGHEQKFVRDVIELHDKYMQVCPEVMAQFHLHDLCLALSICC